MTQPKALYLADVLEDAGKPADIAEACAAELRRLHAELEQCKATCAATSECWRGDADRWTAQREALLEALHAMLSHTAMLDPSQGFDGFDHSAVNQARAAIKAAEENT